MKKILTLVLAIVLLFSFSIFSVYAAVKYGDVNSDGDIDIADAVKLAQVIAKWEVDLTSAERAAADVDADGEIHIRDAVLLAQYIAKWNVQLGGGGSTPPSGGDVGDDNNGDNETPAGDIFG